MVEVCAVYLLYFWFCRYCCQYRCLLVGCWRGRPARIKCGCSCSNLQTFDSALVESMAINMAVCYVAGSVERRGRSAVTSNPGGRIQLQEG